MKVLHLANVTQLYLLVIMNVNITLSKKNDLNLIIQCLIITLDCPGWVIFEKK